MGLRNVLLALTHTHNYAFNGICHKRQNIPATVRALEDTSQHLVQQITSHKDTILCKWQWIFHLGLLIYKDRYLEGKAFITANQRREALKKKKQNLSGVSSEQTMWPGTSFPEKMCLWGQWKLQHNCLIIPFPVASKQILTNGLQAHCGGNGGNSHLTFTWHHEVPLGIIPQLWAL